MVVSFYFYPSTTPRCPCEWTGHCGKYSSYCIWVTSLVILQLSYISITMVYEPIITFPGLDPSKNMISLLCYEWKPIIIFNRPLFSRSLVLWENIIVIVLKIVLFLRNNFQTNNCKMLYKYLFLYLVINISNY